MKTKYNVLIALVIIIVLGLLGFIIWWFKVRESYIYTLENSSQWTTENMTNQLKTYLKHTKYMNDSQKQIYQKIDIPVYYINMDKSVNRRKFMEKQFKLLNINSPVRIPGVPGNSLDNILFGVYEDISYSIEYTDLSPAEVGCTLSHLKAIKTAYDNNENNALILEDDVCFSLVPFWYEKLSDVISKAPTDWEIIQLFSIHPPKNIKSTFILHDIHKPCYGTTAYLINRKGMNRILNIIKGPNIQFYIRKEHSPNGTSDQLVYSLARTYIFYKSLFIPTDHILPSTIHTEHENVHIERTNSIIKEYQKYNTSILKLSEKQLRFSRTLHDMADILDNLQIPFRLSSGTLLGAYRQDEFISHDEDIDLEVLYSDYTPKIEENLDNFKLKYRRGTPEKGYELTFQHLETGVSVDIFFLYDEKDYRWLACYTGRCDLSKHGFCRYRIPKDDTRPLMFTGRYFQICKNTEDYLISLYGPNWNIPTSYTYYESLTSHNYGIIEEDFPPKHRIEKIKESKHSEIWPRKISELSKPIIWLYWQNKTTDTIKPPYLDLCLETVKKYCNTSFEIFILCDKDIPAVLPSINPNYTNIEPLAMRADYIRFCLIHKYGGIWLDCDIIVLKNLSFLIDDLKIHNFVAFEHEDPGDISIGIMAGNKDNRYSKYMKTLFETHPKYSRWKKKKYEIEWAQPTIDAKRYLQDLMKFYPNEIKLHPSRLVYPVHWKKSMKYFWGIGNIDPQILSLPAVYLHNHMYDNIVKKMTRSQVLRSNYRISDLLRLALNYNSKLAQFNATRKYLLFSSIGKRNTQTQAVNMWTSSKNKNFDIVLYYYNSLPPSNCVDYCVYHPGLKFENFYHFATNHDISKYDAIWIVDDDIQIDTQQINKLFQFFSKYDLDIAQPAFSLDSHISHPITLASSSCALRYCNFVENGVMMLSNRALSKCLEVFKYGRTGWGVDYVCCRMIDNGHNIGIIDNIICRHPKSTSTLDNNIQRDKHRGLANKLFIRFNIEPYEHIEYSCIPTYTN